MVTGIQVFGIIFALIQSYFTFLHYKRNEFTLRETLGWEVVWISFAFVTLFPGAFLLVSDSFGAIRPLDFFTIVGFIVVLSISFYTYVNLDKVRKGLEKLIREMAIAEEEKKK